MKKINLHSIKKLHQKNGLLHDITGLFFHNFKQNKAVMDQGYIKSWISDDYYLCQRFEWAFGCESNMFIARLSQMHDWIFYQTAEEMKHAYDEWVGPYSKEQNEKEKQCLEAARHLVN
ncbi:MAG: hypothetical protein EBZ78_13585 [Verrucomicrobia bacterium]|nr:hypothetical protein [Verrucomicrobiota bacterium]